MTASDILWIDLGLYQRRYLKSANALVAIRRVLSEKQPLDGQSDEFLKLFDRAAAFDASIFTRVWSDPTAYFWVRLCYEFVGNCLSPGLLSPLAEANSEARGAKGDSRAALAAHLGDFKRFVLALGILSKQDTMFDEPLEASLPFAIPATNLVIEGGGKIKIHGFTRDSLEVTGQCERTRVPLTPVPADSGSLTVRESPVAIVEDYRLALQPEMFNLPGLAVGKPLLDVTPEFERAQIKLTEQALNKIRLYASPSFVHFRAIIRSIALKPPGLGNYTNISHSDLPGSFVCTVVRGPYWMADAFIHEFYHNRLFFIEEIDSFFVKTADNQASSSDFYSPWREDRRPLHGIFHGLYVYLPLWRFWFAICRSGETSDVLLSAVRDQVLRISLQLEVAVSQLRRFAEFSSFGSDLFETMAAEVASIRTMTREFGFPYDLPAMSCSDDGVFSPQCGRTDGKPLTVRETILRHAMQYDQGGQCEEIDSIAEG